MLELELPGLLENTAMDPSFWVIAATYALAFLLAVLAAAVRMNAGAGVASAAGLVRTAYFRPIDLIGVLWIFAIYAWLSLAQIVAGGMDDPAREIGMADLWVSIGFQGVMLAMVLFVMAPRARAVDWLGLRWPGWSALFFLAPVSVVAMWLVFGMLEAGGFIKWLESLGVDTMQDSVRALKKGDDAGFLILMRFSAIVVAPLCEEVVFRGYLYGVAKRYCGPLAAAVCSALVFSAAHGSLVALLPLALFGLLLAWLYERTGSLWAPIAAHAFFNAATVVVLMFQ